jgi:hypothetical protein
MVRNSLYLWRNGIKAVHGMSDKAEGKTYLEYADENTEKQRKPGSEGA